MPGIKAFYFVEKDDLKCNKDLLQKRFLRTIVVKETRKMHAFLPVSENLNIINVKTRSFSELFLQKPILKKVKCV